MENKHNPKGAGRKRKLTPLEEVHVYQEYKAGKTHAEIAYKNGISVSTLQRIINRKRMEEEE
ncbi:MAG TPA: hypothetical protein GX500_08885 [Firmicutes bacterium]|nr:hypothetical protein [Candidatus Fermentithermobacillaceae bacterium]